jgi:site-specific DNA recombinase
MKRVECLYRVSTKQQVDKDDIPMQKKECHDFIKRMGWTLVDEYYEKGVSGYKVSAKNRDALLQLKQDAEDKRYDVLLVYMFDRLGRKEEETPFVMQDFHKLGIEMWSTQEGEQKFDSHVDKLMNYIRFWQSSGESQKTSMRVTTSHKQMVEAGIYRGGKIPYGYKLINNNRTNKFGELVHDLAIDEEKVDVVKLIYALVYEKGFGTMRIQEYLLENNIPSPTNQKWSRASLQHLLTNPIYKGYMTFGRRDNNGNNNSKDKWILSEKPIPELIIIEEDIWEKVQQIRSNKSIQNRKLEGYKQIGTSSPLLLIGMIKCGHCNSIISTTYNYSRWTTIDGEKKVAKKPIYRCNGRIDKRINCDGQTTYNRNKIEGIVIKQTKNFINELKSVDFTKEIEKINNSNDTLFNSKIKELKNKKESLYNDLKMLNEEVMKILRGESQFTAEMINHIKTDKENQIQELQREIDNLNFNVKEKELEIADIKHLKKYISNWSDKFNNADDDEKKVLLSRVIDSVVVFKEKIEINYKIYFKNFAEEAKKQQYMCIISESESYTNTIVKLFEKQVVIMLDNVA